MSKSSEYVKKWRKKIKEIAITAMGGGCQICCYNKCTTALELHHINPEDKDFGFGFLLASCRNWKVIYDELAKCVLLCANCHREIHADLVQLPATYAKFNAEIADSLRTANSLNTERGKYDNATKTKANALISQKRTNKEKIIKLKRQHIELEYATKLNKKNARVRLITESGVDFKKFGWVNKISLLTGIKHQKVGKWMKNNMKDFYDKECFVRNNGL